MEKNYVNSLIVFYFHANAENRTFEYFHHQHLRLKEKPVI